MHEQRTRERTSLPPQQQGPRSLASALRDLEDGLPGALRTDEIRHLADELEIHRTELEMQNQQLRESRAQLEEATARYTDLYDFAPVAYLTLEATGKIEEANLTAAALFRVERGQLIGRSLHTLVRPESRQVLRAHIQSCLQEGVRVSHEIAVAARGGLVVPTQITSTPIIAGGHVAGCKTTLTDVSALKRAHEVLRFLGESSTVLASSFDYPSTAAEVLRRAVPLMCDVAIIDIFDTAGVLQRIEVAHANPRRARLAAAARQARPPRGRSTPVGWVLETREPLLLAECKQQEAGTEPGGFQHELFVRACSPRSLMYVPIASRGQILGVLTLLTSESERLFGEDDLTSATDLANRIALAIENARLYGDATRAVKAREEVLSFVSHDLKNPLMGILLTTEMLLESAPQPERRRGWTQLDRIRRGVQQMRHMVEDLLDISSIDAGRLSMEMGEYRLKLVVEDALELLVPVAREKKIGLRAQFEGEAPTLRCDRDRLVQVLYNVIGNALKFTPAGGEVQLSTSVSGDHAVVAIKDNGPGIAPELLPRLFQRYAQAQKTARRGRGLGLYISLGIVQAHGGTIWVESTLGQGATFFFTIPLATAPEVPTLPEMDVGQSSDDAPK